MNPRYAIHEEIDRYLNGQMAAAERRAFEEQLASNPSLRADFEAQQVAHQLIIEDSLLDLKKQMQRDMNGGGAAPGSSGNNYRNLWIGLGGGILCFSVFYYLISFREKENNTATDKSTVSATQQATVKKDHAVITTPQNHSVGSVVLTPAPAPSASKENTPVVQPSPSELPAVTSAPAVAPQPQAASPTPDVKPQAPAATTTSPVVNTPSSPPLTPNPGEHAQDGIPPQGGAGSDGYGFAGSHTFQPDVEGTWTIPHKENNSGTFRVISRGGATVYQTHFSSGTVTPWNGNDAAGTPLPGGYYMFMIEYEQGGAEKGSLTILR